MSTAGLQPPALQPHLLPPPMSLTPPPEMSASVYDLLESDPPPSYELDFKGASRQWGAACKAASDLEDVEPVLRREERELEAAKRELDLLKKRSAECFAALHSNRRTGRLTNVMHRVQLKTKMNSAPSILPSLHAGKQRKSSTASSRAAEGNCASGEASEAGEGQEGHNDCPSTSPEIMDQREIAAEEFEKLHAAEMRQAARVAELEDLVTCTRRKRDILSSISVVREDAWAQLQHCANGLSLSAHLAARLGEAMEELNTADSELGLATHLVEVMHRARQTIQHTHHYFTKALAISDNMSISKERGSRFGMLGGFAGMGRITDYQESVLFASRAQVCLTECIPVLSPYVNEMLPENTREDFKALKEQGVLQMAKIYNLVFGGRMIDSGVGKQIRQMLDRQDKVFAHLTQLAVWVQNEVPVSEAAQRRAHAARDVARTRLSAIWTEAAEQT